MVDRRSTSLAKIKFFTERIVEIAVTLFIFIIQNKGILMNNHSFITKTDELAQHC